MKKIYLKKSVYLLAFALFGSVIGKAQYCYPTTLVPYAPQQPGITGFTLNTIARSSAGLETGAANSFVNTGMSTTLNKGSIYTVKMTHNLDVSICPDMNLRVYIDYNHNFLLTDAGETAYTLDNHVSGVTTGTFMVPLGATTGTTQIRATAKMTNNGGHTLPSPCDVPQDPFGYHGEIETYIANIVTPLSVNEIGVTVNNVSLYPNPSSNIETTLSFDLLKDAVNPSVKVFDITGKEVIKIDDAKSLNAGQYQVKINTSTLNSGIYFVELNTGSFSTVKKLIVNK